MLGRRAAYLYIPLLSLPNMALKCSIIETLSRRPSVLKDTTTAREQWRLAAIGRVTRLLSYLAEIGGTRRPLIASQERRVSYDCPSVGMGVVELWRGGGTGECSVVTHARQALSKSCLVRRERPSPP